MKAITVHRYGPPDVLELGEIERPVPTDGEVLVRVRTSSANPRDWHLMRGIPYIARLQMGLRRPKWSLPGSDLAGEVVAVGSKVTRFHPGDEVYGTVESGGFSEYAAVPEGDVGRKPANLSFEEAAAVPLAGLTALQGLRHGGIASGQRVLIIGASGGVGSFAVQLAKRAGAHVTGVSSTRNVDLVRSLGADRVIDYTREDFVESGERYDLILELGGDRAPGDIRRALTANGTLVQSSGESRGRWIGPMGRMMKAAALRPFVRQRLGSFLATSDPVDLAHLTELIETGELRPIVDRTYPLAEIRDAIRQIETGHTRGKIVIEVSIPESREEARSTERIRSGSRPM